MTKKQRQQAIDFMFENEVEFVCAPYGVYIYSACELCCFDCSRMCPLLDGDFLCRQMAHPNYKTFFRKIDKNLPDK